MRLFTILLALASRITTGENWIQIGPFLIQFGRVQIQTPVLTSSNRYGMAVVTFPKNFSDTPIVLSGCDIYGGRESSATAYSINNSNFGLAILHNGTATYSYGHWIAIGKA
jgi:hypothetical protein